MAIEKLLTLDTITEAPNHGASLEFDEMATLIADVRRVTEGVGKGDQTPDGGRIELPASPSPGGA